MKKALALSLVCIIAVGILGCSETDTPTVPENDVTVVGGDKTPPANSGPYVMRLEDYVYFYYYSVDDDVTMIAGQDPREFPCGGIDPELIPILEIQNPQEQYVVNQIIHSNDIPVYIWTGELTWCYELFDADPIYTGTVNFTATDNDLYAYVEGNDSPRVNAYGWALQGTLDAAGGGNVHVNGVWRAVWPGWPADPLEYSFTVDQFNLVD